MKTFQSRLATMLLDDTFVELESAIDKFNIFDAIGMAHQETKHSQFLAFLLDPNANHGLGDLFLKRFLTRILVDHPLENLTAIQVDEWHFSTTQVTTERQALDKDRIDIFIEDSEKKLFVLIENKVKSGLTNNQLERYKAFIDDPTIGIDSNSLKYKEYQHGIFIILSPEGIVLEEQEDDEIYSQIAYEFVAKILRRILRQKRSVISQEVVTLIEHYIQMLEQRGIIEADNKEISALYRALWDEKFSDVCKKLYNYWQLDDEDNIQPSTDKIVLCKRAFEGQHAQALEALMNNRPDIREQFMDYIQGIAEQRDPRFPEQGKMRINRTSRYFMCIQPPKDKNGWDSSLLTRGEHNQAIELVFKPLHKKAFVIRLEMSGGSEFVRKTIYDAMRDNDLYSTRRNLPKRATLYEFNLLGEDTHDNLYLTDEIKKEVDKKWQEFLKDLDKISDLLSQIDWQGLQSQIENEYLG